MTIYCIIHVIDSAVNKHSRFVCPKFGRVLVFTLRAWAPGAKQGGQTYGVEAVGAVELVKRHDVMRCLRLVASLMGNPSVYKEKPFSQIRPILLRILKVKHWMMFPIMFLSILPTHEGQTESLQVREST